MSYYLQRLFSRESTDCACPENAGDTQELRVKIEALKEEIKELRAKNEAYQQLLDGFRCDLAALHLSVEGATDLLSGPRGQHVVNGPWAAADNKSLPPPPDRNRGVSAI